MPLPTRAASILALPAVLALVLSGCGRKDEAPAAAPAATTSASATVPTATPAPATPAPAAASEPASSPRASAAPAATAAAGGELYKVVDGYKVDAKTMDGFRAWRAAACDRCHGANQEGMVGPSLIESLKKLSKAEFVATVTNGRLEKGMPSFGTNPAVTEHVDALYAYLKGRSDGAITRAKPEPM